MLAGGKGKWVTRMYTAYKGGGTFVDGERVHVTDQSNLERSLLVSSRGCTRVQRAWGCAPAARLLQSLMSWLPSRTSQAWPSAAAGVLVVCVLLAARVAVQERGGRMPADWSGV